MTAEFARYFKVPAGRGVIVTAVEPGSAADIAGIQPADVIAAVDDVPIIKGLENSATLFAWPAVGDDVRLLPGGM